MNKKGLNGFGWGIPLLALGLYGITAVQCKTAKHPKGSDAKAAAPAMDTAPKVAVTPPPPPPPPKPDPDAGFATLANGLKYRNYSHGSGTRNPQVTDHIEMNIRVHVEDSVIFDSRKMNNGKPVPFVIQESKERGDLLQGLMTMVVGDSTVFHYSVDSLKSMKKPVPPWAKPGQVVEYNVTLVNVRTDEEEKRYQEAEAAQQMVVDDSLLRDYFTRHKIKPKRTASGLYYTIVKQGKGPKARMGQAVTCNYTGELLNGTKFDSNTDSAFKHVQPYAFTVGRAIKGFDSGLMLLNKGSKAIFYIPSPLGYGSRDQRIIPANSILIFHVDVLDIQDKIDQAKVDDKLLQEYFKKHNIKATKTESGLYYVISQKGLGPNAAPGKTVTMNYTGKLLDGTVFDSNTDPQFGHVKPFDFPLGAGRVIKGWDEGVQLLKIGSKATFFIPSDLGYGERGAGGHIPPNAVLIFDVEVTGIGK